MILIFAIIGAVHRWVLAQPDRAAITQSCKDMVSIETQTRESKALDKSRWSRDEESITNITATVTSMINPFSQVSVY